MKNFFKKVIYLLPEGDPYKLLIIFILMLISAVLEVAGIGMIPAFVSIVATPEMVLEHDLAKPIINYLGISNSRDLLIWGSVFLVSIFIVKSLYIIIFNYFESYYIYNRKFNIGKRLMTLYMHAPYTFHLNRNSSELLRNITNEVNMYINSLLDVLKLSREAVMAISILIFLVIMEPLITLIVVTLSGIGAGGFIFFTQKKVKAYAKQDQAHRNMMIKAVNQGIGGIKDTRLLNRETEFINQFTKEAYSSAKLGAYMRFIVQIPRPIIETTAVLGIMLIAGLMVLQGRPMVSIIPVLTLFAMATVRLMPAVQQISSLYTNMLYNIVAVEPIYEDVVQLKQASIEFREDRQKNNILNLNKEIKARDIWYCYPGGDENALKGVSFEIPSGSAVAFVGESGAGKTTIVDLLLGLLKPTKGQILVDGKNIHDSLSAWQKNIGYIPQSIYMADETLRKNIAYGIPENQIEEEKIKQAIEMAQLQDMIKTLPKGLDTIIGESGTRLSGGQRQRVGIARALYHNPNVLVMDEATSALDNITEKQITKAIEAMAGERTIITIAHRLTTVQKCDMLYLMRDGRIIDSGTYYDLADSNKEFRKMALMDN